MGLRNLTLKQRKSKRFYGKIVMSGIVGIVLCGLAYSNLSGDELNKEDIGEDRRLSAGSCEVYEVPLWAIPLLAFGILWVFDGLAVVCDDFFQPSLEAISEVYIF